MRTTKALGIVVSVVLAIGLLWAFVAAQQPTTANTPTQSITVTKYDTDGTTIVAQETRTYAQMEATLPVQGDGETHYYFQGPTFDPENLWDPDETVNLKNKGAIKGTDVQDLVELVGGAQDGDQIEIRSIDGYGEHFQYANVYDPEPGQGKMVIAWYTKDAGDDAENLLYPEGAYVPEFGSGMQLIYLVETTNDDGKHVFGHDDMRTYLPEDNWHYFYDGPIAYPSCNGASLKWISEVNVFPDAAETWSITVTGAVTTPVSQSWFENALACHEQVEWTDGSGDVWSGLALWYLLGLADDGYVHGSGSFNDALAEAGYDIEVKASDGYTRTFRSEDVRRSSGYIVANKINGSPLSDHYPLRLVGSALTSGSQRVGKIASINLYDIPDIETWTLELSGAYTYTMRQAEFDSAVLCADISHAVAYTDSSGTWEGLPLWLLVGWVDDDESHGADAFNDELADIGYEVRVIAADNFSYTFDIADVARNDDIIVASTLDGEPLAEGSYPLRLVGSALTSGKQKIREIAWIKLLNLPDWELELSGTMTTTLTAADFQGAAAANPASWVDAGSGDTYSGVALWRLAGVVDDDDPDSFSDELAELGYDVRVIAIDNFSHTFVISDVAHNDNIIVASAVNGEPLPEDSYPLRLVGSALTSGKQKIRQIARIELLNLPSLEPDWELELSGAVTETLSPAEFQGEAAAHPASWVDGEFNTYAGVALWRLVGIVDDDDATTFSDELADLGYQVKVIAIDEYYYTFDIADVSHNDDIIVASTMNDEPLPESSYPLRLVGAALVSGGQRVKQIARIELLNLPELKYYMYLPLASKH